MTTGTKIFIAAADTALLALLMLAGYRAFFFASLISDHETAAELMRRRPQQQWRQPTLFPNFMENAVGADPELRSGFDGLYDGLLVKVPTTRIKINSQGFRDREFPAEKPAGTYRIVAIGDSFTFGIGVKAEDTFPKVLERMLDSESAVNGCKVEVLNFGVPGYNTAQEVRLFSRKALNFFPDMVLLSFVLNDFMDENRERELSSRIIAERFPILPEERIAQRLAYQEAQLDAHTVMAREAMITPIEKAFSGVERHLADLAEIAVERDVKVVLAILNFQEIPHLEALRRICADHDWPCVDVFKVFNSMSEEERARYELDPLDKHPTREGHRIIAGEILPAIKKVITDQGWCAR